MSTDIERHEGSALAGVVDREAILRHLNLDPSKTDTQALLLICERYGLDPLLKHMVLISGRPYVTRDGYLAVAHRSGHLDGIEVVDSGEDDAYWWAKVAVYRNDMSHPFVFVGRYPKADAKHMAKYGPEMAIKCGEVMALRRAFNVSGIGAADEQWDEHVPASEPVDPWEAIGWTDEAEHDAAVADAAEETKGLDDTGRETIRALLRENNWGKPYRREWVDAWMAKVDDLTAEPSEDEPAEPVAYDPDEEPF